MHELTTSDNITKQVGCQINILIHCFDFIFQIDLTIITLVDNHEDKNIYY